MTDLRIVAMHEAAHLAALFAHPHLGSPGRVSVVPTGSTEGLMTWPSLRDVGRRDVGDAALVLLAGLAAEEAARGEGAPLLPLEEHGAGKDTRALAKLLLRHRITGSEADALVGRATERARAFVREHRLFIHAIAGVLVSAGTLEGDALEEARRGFHEVCEAREKGRAEVVEMFIGIVAEDTTRWAVERARRQPSPKREETLGAILRGRTAGRA